MQLYDMDDFSFELIKSPLYLSSCAASLVTLAAIRWADLRAEQRGAVGYFDRVLRVHTYPWQCRVRVSGEPLLSRGQPLTSRLFSPRFLFTEVVLREPFSILPPAAGWLCVLLSDPMLGAKIIAGALLWRVLIDWLFLPATWSGSDKTKTIALKLAWCLATGVYLACVVYLVAAAILALLIVLGFLSSGAGKARRSKR